MNSFTIILPFRAQDRNRTSNLLTVIDHFSNAFPDAAIVVVEERNANNEPPPPVAKPPVPMNVQWMPLEGQPLFNKARCINHGVMASRHTKLLIADADMILSTPDVVRALSALDNGLDLVRPYQYLIDMNVEQSNRFAASGLLPEQAPRNQGMDRNYAGEQLCVAGGAFLVGREFFVDIGGFDERFLGWGGEDDAFSIKAELLSGRTVISRNAMAWHLWHPRNRPEASDAYAENITLLNEMRSKDRAELRELADKQRNRLFENYISVPGG